MLISLIWNLRVPFELIWTAYSNIKNYSDITRPLEYISLSRSLYKNER